jgi:cytochrome c peroxidase
MSRRVLESAVVCVLIAAAVSGCSKEEKRDPGGGAVASQAAAPALPPAKKADNAVLELTSSLGKVKVPADNPVTQAKVDLGRKLFFDPRLSADGKLACYSCHLNEDGTGGHDPIAIGANGKKLTRHSPTMWNVAYLPALYWDGRSDTLEAQARAAIVGGNLGVGEENLAKKVDEIAALPEYTKLFDAAFPTDGANPQTLVQALASFERTLLCDDTKYDKFAAGDANALNEEEKKGWELFTGKGNCHSCHTPPFFSDAFMAARGAYHNTGQGFEGVAEADVDIGRKKVSSSASDFAAFKTPSLRNVAKSAPYFHNGSVAKLEDAVAFMASGGRKNPHLDPILVDRKFTKAEVASVVAFLGALNCGGSITPPSN